ncbi:MAG: hypothetical protein IT380_17680 [Myxococcales bacterium]|nr:hypothetical protein [Myxococcales bacterium]
MSLDWNAIYAGPFHHPGLAFAFCLALLLRLVMRFPPSAMRRVMLLLLANTAVDAFLTGALTPLSGTVARVFAIAFVITGDFRFWVLVERFRTPDATWKGAFLRAVPLSFVVPVVTAIAILARPDVFSGPDGYQLKPIFLAYESLFSAFASVLLLTRYVSRRAAPAFGWYLTRLLLLWLAMYGLWVGCDVLLLFGHGWALGLRIVPNVLYYGVFLYAATYFAPREAWT